MNRFELFLFKIRNFFTQQRAISKVKNDLLKMEVSYIEADAKIKEAGKVFEKVKVTEAKKFGELKKNTLFKTMEKIKDLKDEIILEENEVTVNFITAKDKLDSNMESVNELEKSIELLNAKGHDLSRS